MNRCWCSQVAKIGNSVSPPVALAIVPAIAGHNERR